MKSPSYMQEPKNTRTVFDADIFRGSGFILDAIGFRAERNAYVWNDASFPAWRLMIFHDPVELIMEGKESRINAESICVIPPLTAVSYGRKEGYWSHSWLRISGEEVADLIHFELNDLGGILGIDTEGKLLKYIRDIYNEMFESHPDSRIVRHLVSIMFREIRRMAQIKNDPIPPRLLRARKYIEAHYLEKINLAKLAANTGMSQAHFSVSFRNCFFSSPKEYIMHLRLLHAVDLLDNRNLSVSEIAEQSGFSDLYYFSRRFRQAYDMSPSQFRKRR